jgi:hypothetical protein
MNCIENIMSNSSHIIACVFVAEGIYTKLLPSNDYLFWLHYSSFQALGGDIQTHREQDDLIGLLLFFQNKASKPKMDLRF